jgi:hypothetical protein
LAQARVTLSHPWKLRPEQAEATDASHGIPPVLKSLQGSSIGDVMKRIAAFILLAAASVAWSIPANAERENTRIGENGREARKAAKQQQKSVKKNAKRQRKAMKKYQKAQRKAAKQQQHRAK